MDTAVFNHLLTLVDWMGWFVLDFGKFYDGQLELLSHNRGGFVCSCDLSVEFWSCSRWLSLFNKVFFFFSPKLQTVVTHTLLHLYYVHMCLLDCARCGSEESGVRYGWPS